MAGRIFINYRRSLNLAEAQLLQKVLQRHFGKAGVFLDVSGLEGGEHWLHALEAQVDASVAMVSLIAKGWTGVADERGQRRLDNPDDFVRFEIARAFSRKIPVLPLLLNGASMPGVGELPLNLVQLSFMQAMHLRNETFDDDADKIAQRLKALIAPPRQRLSYRAAGAIAASALLAGLAVGPSVLTGLGIVQPSSEIGLRAARDQAQRQAANAEAARKEAEVKYAAALGERDHAQSALKTAQDALAAAQARAGAAAARVAELTGQLENAQQALKEAKAASQEALTAAQAKAGVAGARVAELTGQLENAQRALEELQRVANARNQLSAPSNGMSKETESTADEAPVAKSFSSFHEPNCENGVMISIEPAGPAKEQIQRATLEYKDAEASANKANCYDDMFLFGRSLKRTTRCIELDNKTQAAKKRLTEVRDAAHHCIKPGSGESFKDCPDCPEMVVVPAGDFLMGSPKSENGRSSDEAPQHKVTIAEPFAVGSAPVTVAQFAKFVKATSYKTDGGCKVKSGGWFFEDEEDKVSSWHAPGFNQGDDHPVVCTNWNDATAYVKWLEKTTSQSYRLLSEAEREYITRAGTATPFWWGQSISTDKASYARLGNKKEELGKKTVPVKSFQPNPWAIYQVHGNVWEWVDDCWHDNYKGAPSDGSAWRAGKCSERVLRGGSWFDDSSLLRSASRSSGEAAGHYTTVGLRVARTLSSTDSRPTGTGLY